LPQILHAWKTSAQFSLERFLILRKAIPARHFSPPKMGALG
jgi:hypothetical protein